MQFQCEIRRSLLGPKHCDKHCYNSTCNWGAEWLIFILVIEAQRPPQNLSVGMKQKRTQTHISSLTVSRQYGKGRCRHAPTFS